jgi:phosphoribosylformylglycinamidine synthase
MAVYEIYVEKKPAYAEDAAADLRLGLQIEVSSLRIINRYFVEGMDRADFESVKYTIFSEPPVDIVYDAFPRIDDARLFICEYLPGQFDQRADSCAQCISLATGKERPIVRSAKIYAIAGNISDEQFAKIKAWLINPVESREAVFEKPASLFEQYPAPQDVKVIKGFISLCEAGLNSLRNDLSLAMDISDLQFCRDYFRDTERRDPTITELRVLDTYWSDHCRHTTFLTELDDIQIDDEAIHQSYMNYLALREKLGKNDKPVTLMDMATIAAKALRAKLNNLDESEEINACSLNIKVDVDGVDQDWLLMFKNETHNHPTEIEPFGGAATCLGGAIRDPLSGRSFVYQAMRITGAGNPLEGKTLGGKLPQRKICRGAAAGFSSYGNQIGLATGLVSEIYHSGYAAKRMEIGAVIGAAPKEAVVRSRPQESDVVILLGGRTGRDGCGGATGSSKSHDSSSLSNCGAEVQKGNAPEERKLQRLFRNPQASRLIKRCNDFGAGGVSVSVGELADGLIIDLSKIPKKYEGLDGTELAISESQERMSVVVSREDTQDFINLAAKENLEAVVIASVTNEPRLIMIWNGKTIVNISREFLNSNGAKKHAKAHIGAVQKPVFEPVAVDKSIDKSRDTLIDASNIEKMISSLEYCSQKGLGDRFDSVIGAATVIMPYGGIYQLTPSQTMAAKIPVLNGETETCSIMSFGFDPEISLHSPYHGAIFAVVHSVAKIIASGGGRGNCALSFQEYFERLRDDPTRWGKPAAALLGAIDAQLGLETAAIGGKDSMSGSFEDIDVPPTLVSFAVSTAKVHDVITGEFKKPYSNVYLLQSGFNLYENRDYKGLRKFFDKTEKLLRNGKILSAWAVGKNVIEALIKMCMGNHIGFTSNKSLESYTQSTGDFIIETENTFDDINNLFAQNALLLGRTSDQYIFKTPDYEIPLEKLQSAWESTLEPVYPGLIKQEGKVETFTFNKVVTIKGKYRYAKPKFVIPVFPGTNSEYDTERAIVKAGGQVQTIIVRNLTPDDIACSVKDFEKAIRGSQSIIIPGGFSGGDEPEGSGKFITAFFRNKAIKDAVTELLQNRDGLICGICNGFQALVKLGLVPYGEIRAMNENSPTLTYNKIGRHQSTLVRCRVASNKSPWLSKLEPGGIYIVPISHGEGRFIAPEAQIYEFAANGQIATQYVDLQGNATQDIRHNPNNSDFAIEGITSPDGRVFGRMAHNERYDEGLFKNVPGVRKMDIFAGAVGYYS